MPLPAPVTTTIFVGREKSIKSLEVAMDSNKQIMLVAQKTADLDDPEFKDLYEIGTLSTILQLIKLPDGTLKVLVEGNQRAKISSIDSEADYLSVNVSLIEEEKANDSDKYLSTLKKQFQEYVKFTKKATPEVLNTVNAIDSISRLTDTLVGHLSIELKDKQKILETLSLEEGEMSVLKVERKIKSRVKNQMEKTQREYYLNEQMKAIQKELGDSEGGEDETSELEELVKNTKFSKEAREKAEGELKKLRNMSPMSAEATVVRNYLDWLTAIPWNKKSRVKKDLNAAQSILDKDHFGLEKVKERIVEYLAVQKRSAKIKGPILCLVGPPGVGKTSLGKSVAKATGREFIRISLGGVRDESEIRGHRRTYIGSMPGKIIQAMKKAKTNNPLILLDEIDKMGQDFRGDPASAMLEVLDPEQNSTFTDHYMEVEYDLSNVMFLTTANTYNMPGPLLDRMEIIPLSGYTEDEKVSIADNYLVSKQMKNNGLKEGELSITKKSIQDLIRYFTREAGVRSLEREIAKICRKVVKNNSEKKTIKKLNLKPDLLEDYCGVRKFDFGEADEKDRIGQVTGLAWTQVGGELLTIEAASFEGKGKTIKTGSLGDQAALTVVRGRASGLGIKTDFHEKTDIHIHVPEGATPKDGPSAGVGMCTALVSVLTGIPVRADVAMTGEITLRGQVLPIGGLKEKLLAAHRGGIKTIIIPEENERDLKEIPDNIKADLSIKPVKWIDEVLDLALQFPPTALLVDEGELGGDSVKKVSGNGVVSTH